MSAVASEKSKWMSSYYRPNNLTRSNDAFSRDAYQEAMELQNPSEWNKPSRGVDLARHDRWEPDGLQQMDEDGARGPLSRPPRSEFSDAWSDVESDITSSLGRSSTRSIESIGRIIGTALAHATQSHTKETTDSLRQMQALMSTKHGDYPSTDAGTDVDEAW